MSKKRLYRKKGVVTGLLSGLADYFGWDPVVLRVIFVILLVTTGFFPFGLAYLAMAMIVPKEPELYSTGASDKNRASPEVEQMREELDELKRRFSEKKTESDWDSRFFDKK